MRSFARVSVDGKRDRALRQQPLEVAAVLRFVEAAAGVEGDDAGRNDPVQVEDGSHAWAPPSGVVEGAAVEPRSTTVVGIGRGWVLPASTAPA